MEKRRRPHTVELHGSSSMSSLGETEWNMESMHARAHVAFPNGFNAKTVLYNPGTNHHDNFHKNITTKGQRPSTSSHVKSSNLLRNHSKQRKGYRIYTSHRIEELVGKAVPSTCRTWQVMGRLEEVQLATRGDVVDLTRFFQYAMKSNNVMDGSWMERDQNRFQHYLEQHMSTEAMAVSDVQACTIALWEQKWCDVMLGEMERHASMSFVEQGHLLSAIRTQYGKSVNALLGIITSHAGALETLQHEKEANTKRIVLLEESHAEADTRAQAEYDNWRKELVEEHRIETVAAETSVLESQSQMHKSQDMMRSLNTLFKQMRDDGETVRALDSRENVSALERKNGVLREELEHLRPLLNKNQTLNATITQLKSEAERSAATVHSLQNDVVEKEEMIQNLLCDKNRLLQVEAQFEALQQEVAAAAAAAPICSKCTMIIKEAKEEDGDNDDEDEEIIERHQSRKKTSQNKRLQCTLYRVMLPNLNGSRPVNSTFWTLSVARSIWASKRLDDVAAVRMGNLRRRFPEFVYAFFQPSSSQLEALDSEEERDALFSKADHQRWALYYGIKLLARDHPEAVLFLTFLDEKNGSDEWVFASYSFHVLQARERTTSSEKRYDNRWLSRSCTITQYVKEIEKENREKTFPGKIYINLEEAFTTLLIILPKLTVDEKTFFHETLLKEAVEQKKNKVIDAFLWLKLMISEYREEQLQRRATVRLMFETSTTKGREEASIMDMEQFSSMLQALHTTLPSIDIATLFRASYLFGEEEVSYSGFLLAAEETQFFANCFTPTLQYAAIPPTVSASEASTLSTVGSVIAKHFAILSPALHDHIGGLPPGLASFAAQCSSHVSTILQDSDVIPIHGCLALQSYRQLLAILLFHRMVRSDLTSEWPRLTASAVDRELAAFQKLVFSFPMRTESSDYLSKKTSFLNSVVRKVAVHKVQMAFRARLSRDQGVPLAMRALMHEGYGSGKSLVRHRRALRSLDWLLPQLSHLMLAASQKRPVLNFTEFTYTHTLYQIGSRWEAERVLHDLFVNLRAMIHTHQPRIQLFCAFCGLTPKDADDKDSSFLQRPEALTFYGTFLKVAYNVDSASCFFEYSTENDVTVDVAHSIVTTLFKPHIASSKLLVLKNKVSGGKARKTIPGDALALIVMEEWQQLITAKMIPLQMACAADDHLNDMEGFLTVTTVSDIYHCAGLTPSAEEVQASFETMILKSSEITIVQRITQAAFPIIARHLLYTDENSKAPTETMAQQVHIFELTMAPYMETWDIVRNELGEHLATKVLKHKESLDKKRGEIQSEGGDIKILWTAFRVLLLEMIRARCSIGLQSAGPLPDQWDHSTST